jgi:nucleotide-binding universal stress UspA family protein
VGGIVSAIRGGPASRASIHRAICLAKETSEPLHFLYVVDMEFLTLTNLGRTHIVEEELRQMGEFILLMAQTKAAEEGITAHADIRHGRVLDQIVALSQELDAHYVVVGRPREKAAPNVLTTEQLEQFIGKIELNCNAKVVLTDESDEVYACPPD